VDHGHARQDQPEDDDEPSGGSGVRWLILGVAVVVAAILLFAGARWFS
jgi:hypothetical protein